MWAEEPTSRTAVEHDREAAYFSHVTDREVDGKRLLFVKVHCLDERAFDAGREGDRVMFPVRPCETRPTTC